MPGPVPKRSEKRRRRNNDGEIDSAPNLGAGSPPLEGRDELHPVAVRMWDALGDSGQSQYYTASDWAQAEILVHLIHDVMNTNGRKSATMVAAMQSFMTELLVSEGARRRARLELEQPSGDEEAERVASLDDARNRLRVAE